MPSPDSGDDGIGVGCPVEGPGVGSVVFVEEAVDGSLQVDDGSEYAPFQPTLRELGEEPLDGVEP